jgi:hypothetical protein
MLFNLYQLGLIESYQMTTFGKGKNKKHHRNSAYHQITKTLEEKKARKNHQIYVSDSE